MSEILQPRLSQGVGYGVVVGLGVAFAVGIILITRALKSSFGEDNKSTETFMVANRTVGTGLTAGAVISSWTFTSDLLGAPYLTYWYGGLMVNHLLEIIKVRYGNIAHVTWICLSLLNNIFNFMSMLVGASIAVSSLTGVNVVASTYLLPLGVVVYTYWGGLRATFLTDYIHTFIMMIVLGWFCIKVIINNEIGAIPQLYDILSKLSESNPVEGNHNDSYLSMKSDESLFFGIIYIITNFVIVIMDIGFWQKGFSADVVAAVPGCVIGGNAYLAIPWAFGTIVGLVSSGLVLSYTAAAVTGKGRAVAIILILFMACTSVASAQLIAVSSIISFDIHGTYVNKKPTDRELIRWSHLGVVGCSLFISAFATALHKGGVDLNWTIYMIGIVVCPAPSQLASHCYGGVNQNQRLYYPRFDISVTTTGKTLPCMYTCLTAMFVPLPITLFISYFWPENFDWDTFLMIDRVASTRNKNRQFDREAYFSPEKVAYMNRMSRIAAWWGFATFFSQVSIWPLPMYGARNVTGKSLFVTWIVIALVWLWITLFVANFLPLIDGSAKLIWMVLKDVLGKRKKKGTDSWSPAPNENVETMTETVTGK